MTRQVPVGADGKALDNVFPQTQLVSGRTPEPAPAAPSAIPTAALAVVPPGPGSPQPIILQQGTASASPAPPSATPSK